MDGYKDLNKQEILRRWYAYVDLLEREWTMTADGKIIKIPNNEIAKAYCELLIELHREVAPFRDELMRDLEANPDDEFLQKCVNGIFKEYSDEENRRLIDDFHLEDGEAPSSDGIAIPAEHRSEFVFLFYGNEFVAESFLKELGEIGRDRQVKPGDVVFAYRKYRGRLTEAGGNYHVLFDVIGENGLGLYLMSYQSLTRAFRIKK
ncbi:MAG: hypothetical protein J6034_00345 [Bacteroidaceae bacterium]|nr:hypothetical protein [Bacteroidaceae bacterium]